MREIPLSKTPAQVFNVILAGQYCLLAIYWRQERLYLDLVVNGTAICRGAVCENRADIVQSPSQFWDGSLHFLDTDGERPPQWDGLGDRYRLLYVEDGEEMPEGLKF